MQQNFSHKNKSQLIKTTEEAKIKAKRKLIGSIVMLFIALIILLNVTSKVKPIPVTPQIVTINNVANSNLNKKVDSSYISTQKDPNSAVNKTINAHLNNQNNTTMVTEKNSNSPDNNLNNQVTTANNSTSQNKDADSLYIKPRVISTNNTIKPGPQDILEGNTEAVTITRYYLQIATATKKEPLQNLKQELSQQGVKTTLQQINTPNGTVYRLRVGPFSTKNDASSELSNITEILKNTIPPSTNIIPRESASHSI